MKLVTPNQTCSSLYKHLMILLLSETRYTNEIPSALIPFVKMYILECFDVYRIFNHHDTIRSKPVILRRKSSI